MLYQQPEISNPKQTNKNIQPLQQYICDALSIHTGQPVRGITLQPAGGGSINDSYQIITDTGQFFFVKINAADALPGLLSSEQKGLACIAATGLIRTPLVVDCGEAEGRQLLLLEWIERGLASTGFWENFGRQLAALHHVTQSNYGLDANNYMGALPQDNTPQSDWCTFFQQQRLQPQVQRAVNEGLLAHSEATAFEKIYNRLPEIFETEAPALLHGDLWSGNYLPAANGAPVLIDPAVYYGHRCMDMAMTTLFGGFAPAFYEAYQYHYPLPVNYREQWDICNLYPLLIHLNLFGRSYLADILHTIRRY